MALAYSSQSASWNAEVKQRLNRYPNAKPGSTTLEVEHELRVDEGSEDSLDHTTFRYEVMTDGAEAGGGMIVRSEDVFFNRERASAVMAERDQARRHRLASADGARGRA